MNAKVIVSIAYNKKSGEFTVRERDIVSGKFSSTFCNNLNDMERIFAKSVEPRETDRNIFWV